MIARSHAILPCVRAPVRVQMSCRASWCVRTRLRSVCCVRECESVPACTRSHVLPCLHPHTHKHVHEYAHVCIHVYAHTYACVCMHAHLRERAYAHVHAAVPLEMVPDSQCCQKYGEGYEA